MIELSGQRKSFNFNYLRDRELYKLAEEKISATNFWPPCPAQPSPVILVRTPRFHFSTTTLLMEQSTTEASRSTVPAPAVGDPQLLSSKGVEVAERFAYYGIGSNLITYLTGPLGQSTAAAAANVNAWNGAGALLPLLGAFVADTFLGKYRTIIAASVGYVLGLGLLTLSAILPALGVFDCESQVTSTAAAACPPHPVQLALFFFSLYLVALSQGGHKPCVQAFGADQFDGKDPVECKAKSSFFNWWYFCMCAGTLVALAALTYVQDNVNWGLGFGIPCLVMVLALIIFVLGTRTYRYGATSDEDNGFLRISKVFGAALRNWRIDSSAVALEEESRGTLPDEHSDQLKFLNKALLASESSKDGGKICTLSEVEEAKSVLRLVPIWATCLVYGIVFAQSSTFFTKQGLTMDRTLFPGFEIPPATLQSFITMAICIFIPIYDRVLVPVARAITGKLSGISMLQRIGTGIFLSLVSMVVAAVVEIKRLQIARDHGIIDAPSMKVPMSFWWLVPQYMLFGIADVFTMVGLQEFFYDQVPNDLRSMGLSLYLSIFGVGSFLSSFLISAIDKATGSDGHDSWFSNNINKGHLDYFYWLLAGLSAVQLILYLYFAKSYVYNRGSSV
ncbi:Protein NRT1/ PTR FAMILY 5.10 [Linum grandiflorum]